MSNSPTLPQRPAPNDRASTPSPLGTLRSFCVLWPLAIASTACLISTGLLHGQSEKLAVAEEIRAAVLFAENESSKGTGFACIYRDREFVATNLHVAGGPNQTSFKTQHGRVITLGHQMIVAGDADICFYSITKPFSEYGITPLEFVANLSNDVSIGDAVFCLGNSLGNGVIIQSDGEIKAFGSPRIETTARFVGGNSGGPLIHHKTGKIIGLVTESSENRDVELGTMRDAAAVDDERSELSEISYFCHRADTVKEWKGTNADAFLAAQRALIEHSGSIYRTFLFMINEPGWRTDKKLVENWETYSKFIEEAKERTSGSVTVTEYVNETGGVVRRDVRTRKKTVSEADYEKAHKRFLRGLEWKIRSDELGLEKLEPLGFIQKQELDIWKGNASVVRKMFEVIRSET